MGVGGQPLVGPGREKRVIAEPVDGTIRVPLAAGARRPERPFPDSYPELYRAAYRVAFRLLGSKEEAADVAQEACARVFARWSRVARYDEPVAWVARVAANLAVDCWRRRRTAHRFNELQEDRGATADRRSDDDRIDLHRALVKLPRRQREVVLLRYVADLPERAVASALGCSVGSVKTHGSRGLASLRRALSREDD